MKKSQAPSQVKANQLHSSSSTVTSNVSATAPLRESNRIKDQKDHMVTFAFARVPPSSDLRYTCYDDELLQKWNEEMFQNMSDPEYVKSKRDDDDMPLLKWWFQRRDGNVPRYKIVHWLFEGNRRGFWGFEPKLFVTVPPFTEGWSRCHTKLLVIPVFLRDAYTSAHGTNVNSPIDFATREGVCPYGELVCFVFPLFIFTFIFLHFFLRRTRPFEAEESTFVFAQRRRRQQR